MAVEDPSAGGNPISFNQEQYSDIFVAAVHGKYISQKNMRVALLQCDEVLEKFRPQFGSYVAMIGQMFSCIDDSFEFDSYDCRAEQYPDDLDAYDFFITTGSRASVYDPDGWIRNSG